MTIPPVCLSIITASNVFLLCFDKIKYDLREFWLLFWKDIMTAQWGLSFIFLLPSINILVNIMGDSSYDYRTNTNKWRHTKCRICYFNISIFLPSSITILAVWIALFVNSSIWKTSNFPDCHSYCTATFSSERADNDMEGARVKSQVH